MLDPKDELVSHKGIEELIRVQNLSHWNLKLIENKKSYLEKSYRHLMIDHQGLALVLGLVLIILTLTLLFRTHMYGHVHAMNTLFMA